MKPNTFLPLRGAAVWVQRWVQWRRARQQQLDASRVHETGATNDQHRQKGDTNDQHRQKGDTNDEHRQTGDTNDQHTSTELYCALALQF